MQYFILKNSKVKGEPQNMDAKILEWAAERDLLKHENAPKQFMKLVEEIGEL